MIGIDSMKLIVWDLIRAGKLAQIEYEKNNLPVNKRRNPTSKKNIPFQPNARLIDSIRRTDSTHFKDTSRKNKDTLNLKLLATQAFQQVFDVHHITKDQFYKSYKYYEQHPDKNNILMDSLAAYASRKRQELYMKMQ